MNRILSLLAITAFLITSSACSGKKPLEPSALKSKNVLSVLRDMNIAYEKKDPASFMANVSPVFQDREQFSTSLSAVFSKFESIRFNIQYSRMLIMVEDKGPIKATFNWDAEWLSAGGTLVKNGGRITLVFEPGSFKLVSIDGKNPFIPQQGELPGK